MLRNVGVAAGYTPLTWQSLHKGLGKLMVDTAALARDLEDAHAVLAEAIQTAMRRQGVENPYEQLKALTRGQTTAVDTLAAFIDELPLPPAEEARLALWPARRRLGAVRDGVWPCRFPVARPACAALGCNRWRY